MLIIHRRSIARGLCPLALSLLLAAGCGDDAEPTGAERGPCYPNETCNSGLVCLSGLCVARPDGGAADATGAPDAVADATGAPDADAPDAGPTADGDAPDAGDNDSGVDDTPPEVVFLEPADGTAGVALTDPISALLSETIDPATIDATSLTLTVDGQPVVGSVTTAGASVTFTPDAPLQRGRLHVARLAGTVSDLAGNALGADVSWSFATQARRWITAKRLELSPDNAELPTVAMDPSGNGMAVWSQYSGTSFSIWASKLHRSVPAWDAPRLVETSDTGDASAPQVAMDASGNAMVVYWQGDGSRFNIWACRYAASTDSWGTPQLVETSDAGDAGEPRVAMDASGNAVVVFWQHDGSHFNILANRYTASNGTWATAAPIEASDAGDAGGPHLAINAAGAAVATYWIAEGGRTNVWASRLDPAGGWQAAELLESNDQGNAAAPRVAVDPAGNATVIWSHGDGTRTSIWAGRFDVTQAKWGAPQLVETDDAGDAAWPDLGVDQAGNVTAVWRQHDGTRYNVHAGRFEPAKGGWSTPVLLESLAEEAYVPRVAVERDGRAVAAWPQSDGALVDAWASRFDPKAGAWGLAERIEAGDQGDVNTVRAAIAPGGDAAVVWRQHDGARFDIWASRFE